MSCYVFRKQTPEKPKTMIDARKLQSAVNDISKRRNMSAQSEKGAVMLSVELQLNIEELLQDIEIYKPKNPKHFWMGVSCRDPHITIHHGFELTRYEELAKASGQDGKTMFTEDIQEILSALDRDDHEKNPSEQTSFFERVRAEIYGHADFFPANPATLAADPPETNYYTVVFKADPPKEMVEFRDALFKVFPHTNQFPTWNTHLSIATVPDEKNRDKLIERLKNTTVKVTDLKIGYNIKK